MAKLTNKSGTFDKEWVGWVGKDEILDDMVECALDPVAFVAYPTRNEALKDGIRAPRTVRVRVRIEVENLTAKQFEAAKKRRR